jgi:predicted enzyme related to lactoylglutathione lyase
MSSQNTQPAPTFARDGYLDGVPCFVDTSQPDVEAAQRFYGGLFGWQFEERMPGTYWMATLDGLDVAGLARQPDEAASWNTYIQVSSADKATADAMQLGARVLVPPFDVAEAGRMSVIADPTGAVFCTWEPRGHHGAQLVNAPGTWNWSDIYTPDPSLAEPFYRALFGWEARPVSFGEASGIMWTRPGYGDTLETLDPGVRRRHQEAGAPEGFTDCVGWLMQDDGPSRWAVTFAVDDADESANRAAELGGEVIVPPYDAGPVRVAQVRDPGGAVLTVSRYYPER